MIYTYIRPINCFRYIANRQPGKALPFLLRLRRPHVFDLIRDNNLFTDVQDQALLLVEFDQELLERKKEQGEDTSGRSVAIALLVDHTHSIPVRLFIPVRVLRYSQQVLGKSRSPTVAKPTILSLFVP